MNIDAESGTMPDVVVGPEQEREWPGSSALATACALNLVSLANRMVAYGLRIARDRGVPSVAAFNVLTILHGEGGPLPPSTIAERMILSRGTVTGILDTLERRRLVRRSPHLDDGRMRSVAITARGAAMVLDILPRLHDAEARWMAALTAAQQRDLLRLIAAVQAAGPDRDA